MSLSQELSSFFSPPPIETSPTPEIGAKAPSCPKLSFPMENGKPTIISFLRHCGCPVAESTFQKLRTAASTHPNMNFIAISHSNEDSTKRWVDDIGGKNLPESAGVTVIVDDERQIYAKWGLGTVPWSHVLSPAGLASIWKMGKEEGIWNRPTESGSRWQGSGNWVVDGEGYVKWGGPAGRVDDMIDIDEAISAVV